MQNRKTHFEQVPLEEIRKMVEIQRKQITAQIPGVEKNCSDGAFAETAGLIEEMNVP